MKLTAEEILNRDPIVVYHLEQVKRYMHPLKVVLFGSRADGTAGKRSDTDLAVLTDEQFNTLDIMGAVDVVNLKNADKALKDQIMKNGVVLYEREV